MKFRSSLISFVVFAFAVSVQAQLSTSTSLSANLSTNTIASLTTDAESSSLLRPATSVEKRIENQVFAKINAVREKTGLMPIKWDDKLAEVARFHSQHMADFSFFNHRDLEGNTVVARASKFGIDDWTGIAENIAFLNGYDDPAAVATQRWLASPAHKKNILGTQWTNSAIGVSVAADGSFYFTQIFIKQ